MHFLKEYKTLSNTRPPKKPVLKNRRPPVLERVWYLFPKLIGYIEAAILL